MIRIIKIIDNVSFDARISSLSLQVLIFCRVGKNQSVLASIIIMSM
eukprot:UN04027